MSAFILQSELSHDFVRWLAEARRGSREALGRLHEGCRQYLLLVANEELPADLWPKVAASDLVQNSFVKAHEHVDQFRGGTPDELFGWLRRILLNDLANWTRHYFETDNRQLSREMPLADTRWRTCRTCSRPRLTCRGHSSWPRRRPTRSTELWYSCRRTTATRSSGVRAMACHSRRSGGGWTGPSGRHGSSGCERSNAYRIFWSLPMTARDDEPVLEHLADLLPSYDDALRDGTPPPIIDLPASGPELPTRLHRAQACLRRLRALAETALRTRNTVRLRNVATGRLSAVFEGHAQDIRAVALSPDGRLLATAAKSLKQATGELKLWDLAEGKERATVPAHGNCPVFSADGRLLALRDDKDAVALLHVSTLEPAHVLPESASVSCVSFSPDGKLLATDGKDGLVKLWDVVARSEGPVRVPRPAVPCGRWPFPPTAGPWPRRTWTKPSGSDKRRPGSSYSASRTCPITSTASLSPPTAPSSRPPATTVRCGCIRRVPAIKATFRAGIGTPESFFSMFLGPTRRKCN